MERRSKKNSLKTGETVLASFLILALAANAFPEATTFAQVPDGVISDTQKTAEEKIPETALPEAVAEFLTAPKAWENLAAPTLPPEEENIPASELTKENDSLAESVPEKKSEYVESEVIVKFRENKIDLGKKTGRKKAEEIAGKNDLKKEEILSEENISVYEITNEESVEEKITELKNNPLVEAVQPNYKYKPFAIDTDDTLKDTLWGLDNTGQEVHGASGTADDDIDAPEAWSTTQPLETNIIIAVIDDGISYNHPDLMGNMWDGTNCVDGNGEPLGNCNHGYDFQSDDATPLPDSNRDSHGTHIAGIIGAQKNNGQGVIGVDPYAKLMAVKFDFTTFGAINAIHFARQNGARVINASWGGYVEDPLLSDAIEEFDGLLVTSSGNGGRDSAGDNNDLTPMYPCSSNLENIICVAATDQNGQLAGFSNYGAISVDIAAPGVNINSTHTADGYSYREGTSMAAGFVSGIAGFIWGYSPDSSALKVKDALLESGDKIAGLSGVTFSGKRANAARALSDITQSAKEILSFGFDGLVPPVSGTIDETNHSITITVPRGIDASALSPTIVHTGSSISPASGVEQNFTSPVTYTVTAVNRTAQNYTVSVAGPITVAAEKKSSSSSKSSGSPRVVKDSKKKANRGDVIIQSGKKFSKRNKVALYFSKPDGSYYAPAVVGTNKKGAFQVSYRVNKPKGKYSWYAVDLKTGKKSKKTTYRVY